jgi:predicted PurR-regulated permease PerM
MLGIDRRTINIAWTLFLFALVLVIVHEIGRTLLLFALALTFAFLLAPVVNTLERTFHARIPRVASLGLVYAVLTAAIALTIIPLGTRVSDEAGALASRLPQAVKADPMGSLPIPGWLEPWRPQITTYVDARLVDLGNAAGPMLTAASTHIISGISAILTVVLIPILGFFFLKDGMTIRAAIVESFARQRQPLVNSLLLDLHVLLAQYIRALVLLSLATFTSYSIFLAVAGVAFPILLAGVAAVLEFIPALGPLAGGITIVVVCAVTGYPHVPTVIIFLVIYRLFQDYVLNPYLMSQGIELHPLLVLFGVLAGEQLGGIPGMFFSVPIMAAIRLILVRLRRGHLERA